MYCSHCGKQVDAGSRFCPACGTPVPGSASYGNAGAASYGNAGSAPPPPGTSWFTPKTARLVRPRSPRAIAGVCAAFALHYGWDLTLVRVMTAVVSLFWGVGILAYVICWIAIPEGQYALPPDQPYR